MNELVPTREDWIWLAGFFDGEGGITLGIKDYSHTLQVAIAQQDEELMNKLCCFFGGKLITATNQWGNAIWYLKWNNDKAKPILEGILPFVKLRRKIAEIRFILDWIEIDSHFQSIGKMGRFTKQGRGARHKSWRKEMANRLNAYRKGKSLALLSVRDKEIQKSLFA